MGKASLVSFLILEESCYIRMTVERLDRRVCRDESHDSFLPDCPRGDGTTPKVYEQC